MPEEQSNDQATQQSNQNDQATEGQGSTQQTTEQSEQSDSGTEAVETQGEATVEIDGEQVPLSEVKKWKSGQMRTDDYTRKTQELAEEKRKLARQGLPKAVDNSDVKAAVEQDPEAKAAVELLKKMGFSTNDEIDKRFEAYELSKSEEQALKDIIAVNPDLKPFEKAIRAVGQTSNQAWEDIIHNYGFKQRTVIQRAKNSKTIKGTPPAKTSLKEKSISEMSDTEYAQWKQKQGVGGSKFRKVNK